MRTVRSNVIQKKVTLNLVCENLMPKNERDRKRERDAKFPKSYCNVLITLFEKKFCLVRAGSSKSPPLKIFHLHYMIKSMWTPARPTSHSKIMGIIMELFPTLVL